MLFRSTKLVLLPMIVWWGMFLPFKRYAPMWNWNRWCTACIIALIISIILIPLLYYFYSEAFGVHLLVIDLLILLIAIGCGQLASRHYYCHANGASAWMGLLVILFILSVFAYWTFFTPHLPLFYDKSKGIYGYGLLISF